MRKALITGGAGFIGSTLADRLSAEGIEVVIYDDLSRGRREFISSACTREGVEFVHGDVLDEDRLRHSLEGCDTVFHLAANADVRHGFDQPRRVADTERGDVIRGEIAMLTRLVEAYEANVLHEQRQ